MMLPSSIQPDIELRNFLQNKIRVGLSGGGTQKITVYGDWEKPTNDLPNDFLSIYLNGDVGGIGMDADYAEGYIMVSLYCKMNDDGTVKKNRVSKILAQFDGLIKGLCTENYFFKYVSERFITPTTPNITSGYSVTTLNLFWHTNN